MTALRRARNLPATAVYDPCRRLLAAITLQAVWDIQFPTTSLSEQDRYTAQHYLSDKEIRQVLANAGIYLPWRQVQALLEQGE